MNLLNTITKKNFFLIIALILSVGFVSAAGKPPKPITIRNAVLLNNETIQIYFAGLPQDLKGIKFEVTPKVSLGTPVRKGTYLDFPISVPLTMGTEYTFTVKRCCSSKVSTRFTVTNRSDTSLRMAKTFSDTSCREASL